MEQKLYGLTQSGNRYFYSMGNQEAYAIQIKPFPAAWKKTPSTPWKRTHTGFLNLDNLGLNQGPSGLELDPIAEFDRTGVHVYRLVPSTGKFAFEPDWSDSILFTGWEEGFNWRATVSNLMNEIDPKVLDKLRQFSHFHLNLLEAFYDWPGFEDLLDSNPALAVCIAARIRVGGQKGKRRPMLDYRKLVQASERDIAAAIGFGDSEDVVTILKKLVPDACKPLELINFPELLKNPVTRKTLLDTDSITHPSLLLLRSHLVREKLTGAFLSEVAAVFPHSLDITSCPWGPMLRGGCKADRFARMYEWVLDLVHYYPSTIIASLDDLKERHCSVRVHRSRRSAECGL